MSKSDVSTLGGARDDSHDHPLDEFTRMAAMWSAILGNEVSAEQVGMCMITVKLSRECRRPDRDKRADIANYAECLQAVHDERERRARQTSPGASPNNRLPAPTPRSSDLAPSTTGRSNPRTEPKDREKPVPALAKN